MASLHLSSSSSSSEEESDKQIILNQWKDQDNNRHFEKCLEYLDVVTLIKKKPINKEWNQFCTKAIDDKCNDKKKKFVSNDELRKAVNNYCNNDNSGPRIPTIVEEIASTYGYPIDKWDVSNVTDFSRVFKGYFFFNEPIGSWDVSKATTMKEMFDYAESFNQDISSWNVSNVSNMTTMFWNATSFNQDISTWDVSNVTTMHGMFYRARSFNQDISSWDVSKVKNMMCMFEWASSFNQDLSNWDVSSNVDRFHGMFRNCPFNARQLPWFREKMEYDYYY